MNNLDVETIEKIQDHDQPCIMGSKDEIVSIPDTEPDGTADCIHKGHLTDTNITSTVKTTNGKPSTSDELNPMVGTSPTRLFKDTPNPDRTIDGFLKPTTPKRRGAKSSKDPINPVIPITVIDTSEATKLRADLEAKDIILKTYEEQINYFRYLINDPKYQAKLKKEHILLEMVINTAGSNFESPSSINDHSTLKVNPISTLELRTTLIKSDHCKGYSKQTPL